MAIDKKPTDKSNMAAKQPPLEFSTNPEKEKLIENYKAAQPKKVEYYTRLVAEYPDRAISSLLLKDAELYKSRTGYLANQLPQARAFYDAQAPEARARIDRQLANVKPFYRDKEFVDAVLFEIGRKGIRTSGTPAPSNTQVGTETEKVVHMPAQVGTGTPPKIAV